MIERGLIQPVSSEHEVKLDFPGCQKLPPPILAFKHVSFAYDGDKENCLLNDMEFGIDMESRIVLVGPNGAGKSTLLKLIVGENEPTIGEMQKHPKLQIARYHQHSEELLDDKDTPLDFMMKEFPEPKMEPTEWRKR